MNKNYKLQEKCKNHCMSRNTQKISIYSVKLSNALLSRNLSKILYLLKDLPKLTDLESLVDDIGDDYGIKNISDLFDWIEARKYANQKYPNLHFFDKIREPLIRYGREILMELMEFYKVNGLIEYSRRVIDDGIDVYGEISNQMRGLDKLTSELMKSTRLVQNILKLQDLKFVFEIYDRINKLCYF